MNSASITVALLKPMFIFALLALVLYSVPAWSETKTQLVGRWQLGPEALRPLVEARVAELRREHSQALERMAADRQLLDLARAGLSRAEQQTELIKLRFHFRQGQSIPLDSADARFSDYLERLRRKVKANWGFPCVRNEHTRACEYKTASLVIEFGLSRDGRLQFTDVVQSSGYPIYDDYAVNAIKFSSPFPPVPSPMIMALKSGDSGTAIVAKFSYSVSTSLTQGLGGPPSAQPGPAVPPTVQPAILLIDSSVADKSTLEQVTRAIFGKWQLPGAPPPNDYAVVAVDIADQGRVAKLTITESSGNKDFDEATLRAVEKSAPFPGLRDTGATGTAKKEVRIQERQMATTANEVTHLGNLIQDLQKKRPEEVAEVLIDFFSDGAGVLTTSLPYRDRQTLPLQWSADGDRLRLASVLGLSPIVVRIVRLTKTELVIASDGPLVGSSGTIWHGARSPTASHFRRLGP